MKFVTNIILVLTLIIYIFLPLFDSGVLGSVTGYELTEQILNKSTDTIQILFAILPFVACFCAILFNCMKNHFFPLFGLIFIGTFLFFFYNLNNYVDINNLDSLKINSMEVGFKLNIWLLWSAVITSFISLLPFSFNKHYSLRKKCRSTES